MHAALMVGLAIVVVASGCGRIHFDLLERDAGAGRGIGDSEGDNSAGGSGAAYTFSLSFVP